MQEEVKLNSSAERNSRSQVEESTTAICHTVDKTAETRVAMSLRAKLHAPPHTAGWCIELFHSPRETDRVSTSHECVETINLVEINISLPPRKKLGKQKENGKRNQRF